MARFKASHGWPWLAGKQKTKKQNKFVEAAWPAMVRFKASHGWPWLAAKNSTQRVGLAKAGQAILAQTQHPFFPVSDR